MIDDYWNAGIRHIVALRGDPPGQIGGAYVPRADGYRNATELTAGIRARHPFEVSVGLYPQGHPESPSTAHDIEVLKAKVDAGATRAITQFFFEERALLSAISTACARAASTYPVVPGILPVQNFKQTKNFAARCWRFRARPGSPGASTASTTTRRRASSSPPPICRRAGARPRRPRRHRFPLLHHEPRRSRVRDLSLARRSPEHRARRFASSSRRGESGMRSRQ